ncbi:P-loop NTPase [Thiolapillus sp.]
MKSDCQVGLLDVDLCGPSIPKMFNLEGHSIHQCSEGYVCVVLT